jgi:NAD-dependent deacetylase
MKEGIERVAKLLGGVKRVVVLTGAGVSRESGIPTFREAQTGLWANYDPQRLATPQGFLADPPLVWRWYDWRRSMLAAVQPNPGHYAIAELQDFVPEVIVVTQNIDGLHTKAGSRDVVELHGNIGKFYCFDERHRANDVPLGLEEPPKCRCGSLLRPGVVWFGEALPPEAFQRAVEEVKRADVVFVIGTSGLVYPAASLPYVAKQAGATVVEINPEETPITEIADLLLKGPSGQVFPRILEACKELAADPSA